MIDIAGPLPVTKSGYRYILGVVDVFSRYIALIPLRSTGSNKIIKTLLSIWISTFGFPSTILTDNAPNFTSSEMEMFCRMYNIKKENSPPYYPQGNGIIERAFRTSKDIIYATCKERGINWAKLLPNTIMVLRSTI